MRRLTHVRRGLRKRGRRVMGSLHESARPFRRAHDKSWHSGKLRRPLALSVTMRKRFHCKWLNEKQVMGDNDLPRCVWCLEKISWGSYTQARAAPVAQLVVRLIRNEEVGGSSPSWGTILQFRPSRPHKLRTGIGFCGFKSFCATMRERVGKIQARVCRACRCFPYFIRVLQNGTSRI